MAKDSWNVTIRTCKILDEVYQEEWNDTIVKNKQDGSG